MSTVEDIYANQLQIGGAIEAILTNFKKDGAERKTPDYLQRRLDILDNYWHEFINNHECERRSERVAGVRALVAALPPDNRRMLRLVLQHLRNVCARADKNLMSASNLAVCFGPTLLRAERETVANILELKFYNVIVETLLDHYHEIFDASAPAPPSAPAHAPSPAPAPAPAPALGPPPERPPHNGILRASPTIPVSARNDIAVGVCVGGVGGAGADRARYSPHHHQLLAHFAAPLLAGRSSSSSAESVSSASASPPPVGVGAPAASTSAARVRTLYACLGESEGELSFEPNQIITNVCASPEPGWLRGTLNGRTGLVPENYVEPLP